MKILAIDDFKEHAGATKVARSYDEGIKALSEEKWDVLWLDYSLDVGITGEDVLIWLAEHPNHIPKKIMPVSACSFSNKFLRKKIDILLKEKA